MKRIIIILSLLFLSSYNYALAYPFAHSSLDRNNLTDLIEVYSTNNITVYVGEDMVRYNLFNGQYRNNGNYSFLLYVKQKNEDSRQDMINNLKSAINANHVTLWGANPDNLRYTAHEIFYNKEKNCLAFSKDIFIAGNGIIIDDISDIIGESKVSESIYLNEDHILFLNISNNIKRLLDSAREQNGI